LPLGNQKTEHQRGRGERYDLTSIVLTFTRAIEESLPDCSGGPSHGKFHTCPYQEIIEARNAGSARYFQSLAAQIN